MQLQPTQVPLQMQLQLKIQPQLQTPTATPIRAVNRARLGAVAVAVAVGPLQLQLHLAFLLKATGCTCSSTPRAPLYDPPRHPRPGSVYRSSIGAVSQSHRGCYCSVRSSPRPWRPCLFIKTPGTYVYLRFALSWCPRLVSDESGGEGARPAPFAATHRAPALISGKWRIDSKEKKHQASASRLGIASGLGPPPKPTPGPQLAWARPDPPIHPQPACVSFLLMPVLRIEAPELMPLTYVFERLGAK
jgi:hypothetical protein